jgi:hypothetical protein
LDSVFGIRGHPYPSVILLKLHQPDTRQWIGRLFAGLGGGVISRGLFVSGGFLCLRAARSYPDDTDCRGKNSAHNELTGSLNADDHDLPPPPRARTMVLILSRYWNCSLRHTSEESILLGTSGSA